MQGVQGFDFDHPNRIAIFVALAILGFVGLILGVMVWLGMKSIPIFFILMFFSMQLVTLPKQMLPESYLIGYNEKVREDSKCVGYYIHFFFI
ncbi:Phage infection protein [Staphylococcus aureus]|nr:Phage infection protein [Staphylococcus aureus]